MSKPWGGIGAWAAEAERAEAEEREAAAVAVASESHNFPSLKEAVNTKPKKKKMSLSEFAKEDFSSPGGGGITAEYKGLTSDERLRLPTGPKERSPEEMQFNRLGGGFSNYGRSGPPMGRMRDRDDNDGSWGAGRRPHGVFDEERRGPPSRVSDFDQPSRADEVDNWASVKKSLPSFDSGRQNRYESLGVGMGAASRADEVDNWAVGKKPLPARSSTFGSGFRDPVREPDRWTRGLTRDNERERPRLTLDPPKGDATLSEPVKTNKPNPFGAARPREEVLAEKGLDWKKLDSEIEAKKTSRPTSEHSSRPSSAQSNRSEGPGLQGTETVVKPGPKVNPFGDAKPREVLLEERGKDWRKIDFELEHRGVDRIIRDLDDKVRFGQKAVERPGSGAGRISGFPDRPPSQSGSVEDSRSVDFTDRPRSRGTGDMWMRPSDDRRPFLGTKDRGLMSSRDLDRSRSRERW